MKVKKKAVYTLFYITCVSVLIMLITIPMLFAKNKQIKLLKSEIENNTKQIETLNSQIEELNEEINKLTIVEDEPKEYLYSLYKSDASVNVRTGVGLKFSKVKHNSISNELRNLFYNVEGYAVTKPDLEFKVYETGKDSDNLLWGKIGNDMWVCLESEDVQYFKLLEDVYN